MMASFVPSIGKYVFVYQENEADMRSAQVAYFVNEKNIEPSRVK